jgi:hypothetical protein
MGKEEKTGEVLNLIGRMRNNEKHLLLFVV